MIERRGFIGLLLGAVGAAYVGVTGRTPPWGLRVVVRSVVFDQEVSPLLTLAKRAKRSGERPIGHDWIDWPTTPL